MLPHPISFSDFDSKAQVWDDGPPLKEWSIASRPGEMGIFTRDFASAHFGGWMAPDLLCRVTIYGRMKEVRFYFAKERINSSDMCRMSAAVFIFKKSIMRMANE